MTFRRLATLLALVFVVRAQQQFDVTQCRTSLKGREYIGTLAKTVNGKPCQHWDSSSIPQYYSNGKFPGNDKTASANYCRNPDNSAEGPWCFEEGGYDRAFCDVKYCHGFITSVEPRHIAEGGAVKITIHGKGFAASQFNFGDESHVGNEVMLTNDYETHSCDVFKDATNEEMIQCYTPAGLSVEQWKVRGKVNGVVIPDSAICGGYPHSWSCSIMPSNWMSPYIDKVVPRSGEADGLITITGKLFTDLYGSLDALSSNGKTEKILRVYVHGRPCELKNGDEFYGVQLDHANSDYGFIKCKISSLGGAFNGNVSVIIEAPYGRTYIKPSAYHVSGAGKIFTYQSYATVDSVSAHSGSVEGGHVITITGHNFDDTNSPAEVKVGNDVCAVKDFSETKIVCSTPSEPTSAADTYPGNRGMRHDFFNTTLVSYADLDQLEDRTDQAATFWTDGAYWCETASNIPYDCTIPSGLNNYMVRSTGYFVPRISGDYEFLLRVDDNAKVYFGDNRTELLSAPSSTNHRYSHTSEKMALNAGSAYKLEMLSREHAHSAYLFVGAKLYKPNLVERIDDKVEPEIHTVAISSEEDREEVTLTRTDLTTKTAVSDVQKVTVTFSNGDGIYQLGINGVYSDILDAGTDANNLEKALNDLPTIYPDTVAVSSTAVTNGMQFTITFNSKLGDWPSFQKKTSGGATVVVNDVTDGIPSYEEWRLHLEHDSVDLVSDMLLEKLPTAETMTEAVRSVFSARCPRSIGPGLNGLVHYDGMEEDDSPGTKDFESEPFCGRASSRNPGTTIRNLDFDMQYGGHMCFAYRGQMRTYLRLHITRPGIGNNHIYPQHSLTNNDDESVWQYACLDLVQLAQTIFTSESKFILNHVEFYSETNRDLWLDELTVGYKSTTDNFDAVVNDRRLRLPARVDEVSVKHNETLGTYDISLRPHGCVHDFQMMRVFLAPKMSGGTGTSSSAVKFGDAAAEFQFARTSSAAPPVEGTYQLTVDSISKDLPADLTGYQLNSILNLEYGINDTKVQRKGSCYGYSYDIEYTGRTGDAVPSSTVDGTNLVGNTPVVAVDVSGAHIFYDPIPGDLVTTSEPLPQVRVILNNILSRCDGDCSYEYKDVETPSVTAINPTSGSAGTVLTISGTMFSTTNSENTVQVGEASCTVTDSTAEQITCTLQAGAIGSSAAVDVYVESMGKATSSSTFDYNSGTITAVSPVKGSTAGGTYLTITGNGFTAASAVTVVGSACTVLNRTTALIVCETSTGSGQGAVEVKVPDTLTLANSYTYSAADTVDVTSFTPTNPSTIGGEVLALQGTFTGIADLDVELTLTNSSGPFKVAIDWTTTDESVINAPLPALVPGTYTINLRLGTTIGFTTFTSSPTLTVVLQMNALSVRKGSFEGGTRLVIAGEGFGTDEEKVKAMVGPVRCDVEEVTNTQITCYTGKGSRTHVVTNGGTNPDFGLGYQWQPITANIQVNERVRFVWTSPPYVTTNLFKIVQTVSADGDKMEGGFTSGNGSSTGEFTHQFNTAGTYYYTTGKIGKKEDLEMRGKVVVSDKTAYAADVTVTVGGVEAIQSTGSATDGAACAGITSDISGCSDADPGSSGNFDFSYVTCLTPSVTAISVTQGYIDTDITITGTGFSTTACDNEVRIGDYTCVPSVQETEKIVCNMDASEMPKVGISYPVSVRVNNRGLALWLAPNSTFALLPSFSVISPSSGSIEGGTLVTIAGAGFEGEPEVLVKTTPCNVITSNYTDIICKTSKSYSAFTDTVTGVVTNSFGTQLPVSCTGDCEFAFSDAATPALTNLVQPDDKTIRDSDTTLVFTGKFLGVDASGITVMVGNTACDVTFANDTAVSCDLGPTAKGTHLIVVDVEGYGLASSLSVMAQFKPFSVTPSAGSLYGGQVITVSGTGFVDGKTQVEIDGSLPCILLSVNLTTVICTTTAASSYGASRPVLVSVDGSSDNQILYDQVTGYTPKVTSISPTSGGQGDSVTITGSVFSTTPEEVTVDIGGAECTVTASTETSITCTLGGRAPGDANILVNVVSYGNSNSDITFLYKLTSGSIAPNQGSFGGGQEVVISGSGFYDGVDVKFCDKMAEVASVAADSLTVITPSYDTLPDADVTCNVVVTLGDDSVESSNAYTYTKSSTPVISSVNPKRGGTQGGTKITISGTNFGASNNNNVSLHGTVCAIESQTNTEIVCETNAPGGSFKTNVLIVVGTSGHSMKTNSDFWYVDVWSSSFTWGGGPLPAAGELLVVPEGQLLLLDQDTPVLKMLLIQGGELLFDEKDITLRAENILIVGNGKLTVGTEEEPFQHNAVIEMHGQLRAPELPIYGAKALAVREGELNLHGKTLRMTWTRLASTASVGDTEIHVEWGQADWPIGGTIAIATTGDRHSQKETELRVITAISSDGKTFTLDKALEYEHLGISEDLGGGHMLEMRAEVGLLTRNVKVIGTRDQQWSDEIEACPEGFDTGEFATQTCFQGRFGNETGSDQFGAQIMFHAPVRDTKAAVGKLSYIEVNYAGQAFRLGRYPIHFHLNGDMSGSYVRGLAIHETFNRAVNIHGTHNILIEHTVIYNIMGGAFFLEDGIETGNIYRHNLALFVKASTSLLNDDITPAAFWATNPNNTYEHNSVAGGTHFGFWYRLLEHPEGPSATHDICPRKVPLGVSYNNSVHSNGWFGLWTFQDYYPMVGGGCDSTTPEPAVFRKFTVWNCEKGLEYVNGGALQFVDCLLANNKLTALEGKRNMLLGDEVPYTDDGPLIKDSIIAAYAPNHPHDSGGLRVGVVLPWSAGFVVKNVTFINFDKAEEVVFGMTAIQGTCSELCGGWSYYMSQLKFVNGANHLAKFRWLHDGVFVDLDGTYTGREGGGVVLPYMDTLNPADCSINDKFSVGVDAAVCDKSLKFSRFSFNKPNLASMLYKDVHFTNGFGTHKAVYADKRMTHPQGWTTVLQHGQTYKMVWENVEHITNISYSSHFEDLSDGGIVITHNMSTKPDRVQISAGLLDIDEASSILPNYASSKHGDFYFSDNSKELSYIVSDVNAVTKRAVTQSGYVTRTVSFNAVKCYWPDCTPPPDQNTLPPITERPDHAIFWSNTSIWANGILPLDDSDVEIEAMKWVVADIALPKMKTLLLTGNLELDNKKIPGTDNYRDFVLEVEHLIILGGRLVVGWETDRFLGNVEIILHGTEASPEYQLRAATPVGQKAIGVFGGLDLHGMQRSPVSSTLQSTSQAGATSITVRDDVDWMVGEEIMVTSTSYDAHQTEIVTITAITDKKVISISPALVHRHLGEEYKDVRQETHSLRAEVSLITRNIKVRGGDHANLERLGFGGRVLVGAATDDADITYIGWARISYTQFIHMGQLGYTEAFDPRYAVSYVQTGPQSNIKPSWMKGNSFHLGLSPQIGLFGCAGLNVLDNIMYQVVGGGMVVYGDNHRIERNVIALNLWTGTYNGRYESKNVAYEASFEMVDAGEITFVDNVAAGSERAGFRVAGEPCEVESKYINNRVHSSMFGVMMWEGDENNTKCFQVSNYFVWRCTNFGIFIQTPGDRIELHDNRFFENHLGLWTNTYSPPSLKHERHRKSVYVQGGIISGPTSYYDCTVDVTPNTNNYKLASLANSWRIGKHGMVGFSLPNADSGPNGLPTHPFRGRMSYPTIEADGRMYRIVMAHWQKRQCNGQDVMDYVVSSNPSADDLGHPLFTSQMIFTLANMDVANIVYFHRPNVNKVNPSDCVDMECDGHKKNMIVDEDSSLAPIRGISGIPQEQIIIDDAAHNWDGDARFGVGDYRIPKVMLTYPNSTRRDPPVNKGIHQTNCTYQETWQAFVCHSATYRLLVIESMDADTEVRRLSPIALRSVTGNENGDYIDLLNGPQDHGWCAGYTCQKRLSTFWAVVEMGLTYELYMTGSNPQHTRFYLLNADSYTEFINLAVYYNSPQRLDVFSDNVYVYPTNAEIESDGNYKLKEPTMSPSEYIPKLEAHGVAGANYFDREWQLQYIHMIYDKVVDIFVKEVVIVSLSLPPMTNDEFFGEAIVENLALFLGISMDKIRVVNVVRETSTRRRRQNSGITIEIEIGDPPAANTGISDVNNGDLSRTVLVNLTRQVVDAVQLGTLGGALNLTILGVDVTEPLPIPENSTDSDWASLVNASSLAAYIQIPSEMIYAVKVVADKEQQPFPTQPVFEMYDASGALVEVLGSREDPWKIRAVLRAGGDDPDAILIGNTTCGFKNGICTFTNLGISHSGSGYIIDFAIFDPAEAQFSDVSATLTLVAAELTAGFSSVPDKDSLLMIGEIFNAVVDIRDMSSLMPVEDIAWRGHTWTAKLSIYAPEMSPAASLNGTLEATFDPATGMANFTDLSLSAGGRFSLKAMVTSDPAGYSLTGRSSIIEISHNVTMQRELVSYNYTVKSLLDYDMHASGKEDIIEAAMYNHLKSLDNTAKYHDFTIRKGSIYIDFWATGEDMLLVAIRDAISSAVQDGTLQLALPGATLTFDNYLYVDGETHFTTTSATSTMSVTSPTAMPNATSLADNENSNIFISAGATAVSNVSKEQNATGLVGNHTGSTTAAAGNGGGEQTEASSLVESKSNNTAAIVAGSVCGVVLLLAIIGAAIVIKCKKTNDKEFGSRVYPIRTPTPKTEHADYAPDGSRVNVDAEHVAGMEQAAEAQPQQAP